MINRVAKKTTAKRATDRFRRLISHGFFAPELPPCFVSKDLAKWRESLWKSVASATWKDNHNKSRNYEFYKTETFWFNFPRFSRNDRRHGIINPIAFLTISKIIADNSVTLRGTAFKNSDISASPVIFDWSGTRAILRPNLDIREDFRVDLSSRREYFVSVDIRAFYHSIYTHSIPWAIHGKEFAKSNRDPKFLGNLLDRLCRNAQDGQTLGLPVGPDTSRVLAEVVASGVDAKLKSTANVTARDASRYIDDYTLSTADGRSEQALIAAIRRAAAFFELELNHDKTAVVSTSTYLNIGWKHVALEHRPKQPYELASFQRFFYEVARVARELPETNVEKWALQNVRVAFLSVESNSWRRLQKHLINAYRRNSTLISLLVELLIVRQHDKNDVDIQDVRDFVDHRIPTLVLEDRTGELVWILFMAIVLNIYINAERLEAIFKIEEPMCALLIMLANKRGLIIGNIDATLWNKSLNVPGLDKPMWLYSYEGPRAGIVDGVSSAHIEAHTYFSILRARNVSFLSVEEEVQEILTGMARRRTDNIHQAWMRQHFEDDMDFDGWDIGDEEKSDEFEY